MRTLTTQELKAVSGGSSLAAPVAQYSYYDYGYDSYYYYPVDYYYYYPSYPTYYGYNSYYYDPYSYYAYDYLAAGLLLGAAAGYAFI